MIIDYDDDGVQDTAEVQEAKARFGDAFADAEAGIVSIMITIMINDHDIDITVVVGMMMMGTAGRPAVHRGHE